MVSGGRSGTQGLMGLGQGMHGFGNCNLVRPQKGDRMSRWYAMCVTGSPDEQFLSEFGCHWWLSRISFQRGWWDRGLYGDI
jgi:hypothetical protein